MDNQPLISGIIIFFNAEKFFVEAIESVLAQTYDNWELILADDGSTDRSTDIALEYARQYPTKVRYVEHAGHQNLGMSATRNLGIRNTTGEYIAFLDADDVWLPPKLEQQLAIIEAHSEVGMVCGRSQYWHSWTSQPEDSQRDYISEPGIESDTIYQPPLLMTLCYPLGQGTPPPPSDILLRTAAIAGVGGFEEGFERIYQLYEDQAFFAKLYLHTSVYVASQCWDKYRLHPDSCCSVVNEAGHYDTVRLFFLNWLEKYLSTKEVRDAQVLRALSTALFPYRHPILFKLTGILHHLNTRLKRLKKSIASRILLSNFGTESNLDR
jgi:glycosyltransferase involved in cell wall biosynthesis